MNRFKSVLVALALGVTLPVIAQAQSESLRVGFISTNSGPQSIIGKHMVDGFMLGVMHSDGALGGLPTEVIVGDDQVQPDVALQVAERMLQSDQVDIISGVIWSNVMMSVVGPITDAEVFLIGSNAGPSPLAGAQCSPFFFSTSWQNDQVHSVVGQYMQDQGVERAVLIAPNYQAGRDGIVGVKRYFQGEVIDEIYTDLSATDFSLELSRVSALDPEAVYIFMPGALGINFVKQYTQAGLSEDIPLYSAFTLDGVTLPAIGEEALGLFTSAFWTPDIDNAANETFVADFIAEYGYEPSAFSAQSYDAARLIDSAVRAVGGNLEDKDALRAAFLAADFDSVRGEFAFNTNQFPIQDFHMAEVVTGANGSLTLAQRELVFTAHEDAYVAECSME